MKTLLTAAALVFLPIHFAAAQPLAGETVFSIPRGQAGLWDLSGSYTNGDLESGSRVSLEHRANGSVVITDLAFSFLIRDPYYGPFHVSAVSSGKGRAFGLSPAEIHGDGHISGRMIDKDREFRSMGLVRFSLMSSTNGLKTDWLLGHYYSHGHFGSATEYSGTIVAGLATTGAWDLSLQLSGSGNSLTGTATATLSNGRTLTFKARGHYNPKQDLSVLTLSGTGDGAGAKLNLQVRGADRALVQLRGRAMGQRLIYPR